MPSSKTRNSLREGLQSLLQAMYPTLDGLYAVSDEIYPTEDLEEKKKNREKSRQARDYGKSPIVMVELLLAGFDVKPDEFSRYVPKIRKFLKNKKELSILDELFEEVIRMYGVNEVIAWLRLLIAKHEIKEELGLSPKKGRRPKNSK